MGTICLLLQCSWDTLTPVPHCPDTSAPASKCLGAKVSRLCYNAVCHRKISKQDDDDDVSAVHLLRSKERGRSNSVHVYFGTTGYTTLVHVQFGTPEVQFGTPQILQCNFGTPQGQFRYTRK